VAVTTARSLNQAQQRQLQTELPPLLGSEVHCRFSLDPSLLSGFRLSIGDQVLHANLGDELAFFSRSLFLEAP
jgi:F-type H+-transporting ATPase subunit b